MLNVDFHPLNDDTSDLQKFYLIMFYLTFNLLMILFFVVIIMSTYI